MRRTRVAADPDAVEVDALIAALRIHRDAAMVAMMVLGGLRCCEVLGLRMEDLRAAERRVFIADGKGGHQRLIPASTRSFTAVAAYLETERPADADSDRVFVALKGSPRAAARGARAGRDPYGREASHRLTHATCHELRAHLPDPAAAGGDGAGGGPGPSRPDPDPRNAIAALELARAHWENTSSGVDGGGCRDR